MKFTKRALPLFLIAVMIAPMWTTWNMTSFAENDAVAAAAAIQSTIASKLDGETSRTVKTLYNGVTRTSIKTSSSSKYETESFHILEFDPSQADLYVDVTNERSYANNVQTTLNTVKAFNNNNGQGKTAIAAINGDLWMTNTFSVATTTVTLPRGFNVYNGEIITSAHMPQEEPYQGEFWSFGMTNSSVPMIGCPELEIKVKNNTKGNTVSADGLNRLPANNALVVYTDKGCLNNYAQSDAYEVVIDVASDYTVKHGATITGTVSGIYSSSTSSNPQMQANRIILTARGTKTSLISTFAVGNTVTLDFTVTERYGRNTEGWQNVYCAVGGHMPFVVDGVKWETGTTNNYPSTIVGITNSGKVLFITDDIGTTGTRGGMDFNDYWDFADDMDLNTAFILDGGGSTTFVDKSSGSYAVINNPTDGSARSVVNSVILSAGPKKTDIGKYEVKYPDENIDLTNLYFATDDAYLTLGNFAETTKSKSMTGAKLTVKDFLTGPSVSVSYGLPNTSSYNSNSVLAAKSYPSVNASTYPYMVIDISITTADKSIVQFQALYHTSGSRKGVSADTFIGFNNANNNAGFGKYVINPGSNAKYTGSLNTLRYNFLYPANGVTVKDGDSVTIRSVRLAKTAAEAQGMTAAPSMLSMTLNANGGSVSQTKKYCVYGQKYGSLPTPTRSGYTFLGWYTATSGGTKITNSTKVSFSGSKTFYAQWQEGEVEAPVYYNVTFNAGDGAMTSTGSFQIQKGDKYSDIIGSMPSATRNGYTLTGWYCEKFAYTLNLSDSFAAEENVVFDALWAPRLGIYKVTASSLNVRSGPGSSYDSLGTIPNGAEYEVLEVSGKWARIKYNGVDGWSSLSYLEFVSPKLYTLSFNVNGGVMPSGYSISYKFEADQKFADVIGGFPVPTRSGYDFAGWQRTDYSPDLWVDTWGTQPFTFGHDVTLKATWVKAHVHSYTAKVTLKASCTEEGVMTYTCSCNDSYTEAIPALGHTYSEYFSDGNASCSENGTMSASCDNGCGTIDTKTEEGSKLSHKFGNWYTSLEPTYEAEGEKRRDCENCTDYETEILPKLEKVDTTPEITVDGYNVMITNAAEITYIRYAKGEYTTSSDIKNAADCVTLNASKIAQYTENGICTLTMPDGGIFSLWIKTKDGTEYIMPADLSVMEQTVTSYGVTLTVNNLYGVKDFFIAPGEYSTYSEVKANYLVMVSSAKINGAPSYSYICPEPGIYTVYIRYDDSARAATVLHTTLVVTKPEFNGNGLQVTLSNLEDIKVVRTAYGVYKTPGEIKRAEGQRSFSGATVMKSGTGNYTIQYRENGTVTVAVVYKHGYEVLYIYEIQKKVPYFVQNGNTVTIGQLDDLNLVRYAQGEHKTSAEIKNAPGSKVIKSDAIVNGYINVTLSPGTYTFCVQYKDESYNYYVVNVK